MIKFIEFKDLHNQTWVVSEMKVVLLRTEDGYFVFIEDTDIEVSAKTYSDICRQLLPV